MQIILCSSISNPQGERMQCQGFGRIKDRSSPQSTRHEPSPTRPANANTDTDGGGRAAGRGGGRTTYDSAREVDNEDLEESRPPRLFHRDQTAQTTRWEEKQAMEMELSRAAGLLSCLFVCLVAGG
jgi:hypothetical protein